MTFNIDFFIIIYVINGRPLIADIKFNTLIDPSVGHRKKESTKESKYIDSMQTINKKKSIECKEF